MSLRLITSQFRHGLTFIATLAFLVSFFGSRLFATLFPNAVVVQGGIHVHHFWYGLALMSASGWMGIAWRDERLYRIYALLYGLGAGFVGDEIGLLLTLGNYQSELTYQFFVAAISFVIIATLFLGYRAQLRTELLKLSVPERALMVGAYLIGFSIFLIFLASDVYLIGIPLALVGLSLIVYVYARHRKSRPDSVPSA
jgi:hypothetical protein